jgi:hypothetical protein
MATIKYNEDEEGNKKIILKDGKVSCECCGYCNLLDIDILLYEAQFSNNNYPNPISLSSGLLITLVGSGGACDDSDYPPDPAPEQGRYWYRVTACWRFLCRHVTVNGGQIASETNFTFGGPTTTGKNLWTQIARPIFGDETESGSYLYSVSFKGWRVAFRSTGVTPQFVPSDLCYDILKWKITKPT